MPEHQAQNFFKQLLEGVVSFFFLLLTAFCCCFHGEFPRLPFLLNNLVFITGNLGGSDYFPDILK